MKKVYVIPCVLVVMFLFCYCSNKTVLMQETETTDSISTSEEASASEVPKVEITTKVSLPFITDEVTSSNIDASTDYVKPSSVDYEYIIYRDFETITDIIYEQVGEGCRIVNDTLTRMGKKYDESNGIITIDVGFTLGNDYYMASMKGNVSEESSTWELAETRLVTEEVDQLVDLASEAFFKVFLTDQYGDNILDKKVIKSHFEGMIQEGYNISLDFRFKVKEGCLVICAGSTGPADEKDWYQGYVFIRMKKTNEGYEMDSFGTSP